MKFRRRWPHSDPAKLQMSAMIDIVFLLLVFFVMTFKIVAIEGDFQMHAPLGGEPGVCGDEELIVRLRADQEGNLAEIQLNGRGLDGFDELRSLIIEIVSVYETAEFLAVTLDCDFGLKYEVAIDAISTVRGFKDDQGNIVELIPTIRFAPPSGS